jgi:hypothetical protein
VFQSDGDEHPCRAGGFALFLLPTAERAEADAEQVGKVFLSEIEGLADFGDFALGFLCLGRLAALGLRIHRHAGEGAIGLFLDAEHSGGRAPRTSSSFFALRAAAFLVVTFMVSCV